MKSARAFWKPTAWRTAGRVWRGDFIWSLTYTCLGSGWTEGRAVWNKGAAGVVEQTQDVEVSLPFALLGMDFDNGSEWLKLALGALPPGTQCARETDALAALSQRRQRARGTKELDVAAPGLGLPAAGESGVGAAHQPALQRDVGTAGTTFSCLRPS